MSDLEQLAAEINARLDRPSPDHRLAAGLLLRQAKKAVPHGDWGAWTAANIKRSRGEVIRLLALAPAGNLPALIPQKHVAEATIKAATMVHEATIKAATITAAAKIEANRIVMSARIRAGEIQADAKAEQRFLNELSRAIRKADRGTEFRCSVEGGDNSVARLKAAAYRAGGVLVIRRT
jgi:hypothetical protein